MIKILSLNVSLFDENNDQLTNFLKKISPDIACFQEVTRKVENSALDSFISKDAIDKGTLGLANSFYAPNWVFKDFKQINFHGRKIFEQDFKGLIEAGNYVKSKFEIFDGKGIFVQDHFSYQVRWSEVEPGKEPRMVQVVDLKINNTQKLRVLNYHGIWSRDKQDTDRTKSASEKLVKLASEIPYPSIICGDFNLFPDTESIKIMGKKFVNLVNEFNIRYTRPKSNELSKEKRNVVDYIFISKNIKVKKLEVIETDVSDHFPLFLEFNI